MTIVRHACLLFVLTLAGACARSPAPRAEPLVLVVDAGAEAAPPASAAPASAAPDPLVDAGPGRQRVFAGVTIALPEGATLHPVLSEQGQILHVDVYLEGPCPGDSEWTRSACVRATFDRVDGPAPATFEAAVKHWDSESEGQNHDGEHPMARLGEGVTERGVMWAMRTFTVRIGFRAHQGVIHTWKDVSRVYAILPVDERSHARCTGHVERRRTSETDPGFARALAVCQSMRVEPAGRR